MVKKFCALAMAAIAFSSWASNASMAKVDATTQATIHNNIKMVLPLSVASDSVIVKWKDGKNRSASGTVTVSYGATEASMTKKTVTATKITTDTTFKASLSGLTPGTTYKLRVEVSQASGMHGPCADTTTITTKSTTFAVRKIVEKKEDPIELLDHSIRFGSLAKRGDRIVIVDTKGKTLFSHFVTGNENSIGIPSSAKGVVLLTCTRSGNLIASSKGTTVR